MAAKRKAGALLQHVLPKVKFFKFYSTYLLDKASDSPVLNQPVYLGLLN